MSAARIPPWNRSLGTLTAGAGLIAIVLVVVVALEQPSSDTGWREAPQDGTYPVGYVASTAAMLVAESLMLYFALGRIRPGRIWMRSLAILIVLLPWVTLLLRYVVHAPRFHAFHVLYVCILLIVVLVVAIASALFHVQEVLSRRRQARCVMSPTFLLYMPIGADGVHTHGGPICIKTRSQRAYMGFGSAEVARQCCDRMGFENTRVVEASELGSKYPVISPEIRVAVRIPDAKALEAYLADMRAFPCERYFVTLEAADDALRVFPVDQDAAS